MEYKLQNHADSIEVEFTECEIYERISSHAHEKLFRDLSERGKNITLNFKVVEVIDSLFIGALIVLFHKLKSRGFSMRITNLNAPLKDLFDKIKLTEYFKVPDQA